MAYRTRIEGVQVFGNNDYFQEYADFLEANGIKIDEDGMYDGYITDIKGLFDVIDKITRKLIAEQHERVERDERYYDDRPAKELADLSASMWLNDRTPILWFNKQMIENAYIFLPYQVYQAVKDKLEPADKPYVKDEMIWFGCSYKLKDGEQIHVDAS